MQYLLVALGGALGSVLRFAIANGFRAVMPATFPWATFSVNVVGSLLAGLLYVLLERQLIPAMYQPVIFAGFLGGFTTYSAYALDSWHMLDNGNPLLAMTYIAGTTLVCLVCTFIGVIIARGF